VEVKDHSIYGALFNANKMGFPWRETLDNWTCFLNGEGQISLAINTSEDDTFTAVTEYTKELAARPGNNVEYTITATEIDYANPLFDGMIKNEALKRCNRAFCTLLDIDEVLPLSNREAWEETISILANTTYDALFLPVIDLYHDEYHYKSLSQKWYMHKNKPYLKRGRVSFAAREDGSTDIERSDTCELIREDGSLANSIGFPIANRLAAMSLNQVPYVVHTGWLGREQRLRQSSFWAPVWSARDGRKVERPLTEKDLDNIPYYPHTLPHWNEE
jgi:hypothetical protein